LRAAVKVFLPFFCLSLVFLPHHSGASTPAETSSPVKKGASTEKWEYYASDEDGARFFYNPETIQRRTGNHVSVTVRAIYSEKNPKYTHAEFQWEIDCAKKDLRGLSAKVEMKDGTWKEITEPSAWSPIPAESTAEPLHEAVCRKKDAKTPNKP
jgi:hypothetical protein